jgi:hypothetical protein
MCWSVTRSRCWRARSRSLIPGRRATIRSPDEPAVELTAVRSPLG